MTDCSLNLTARQILQAELIDSLMQGARVMALTGPAGAGKTALAAAVREQLRRQSAEVLHIDRGSADRIDLRALTCRLLDKAEADFDTDDIEALFDVMTTRGDTAQRRVLVVDDADRLGADALGYLRLLSGIAAEEMPQILFVGRPCLLDTGIADLVTDHRELEPLAEPEVEAPVPAASPDPPLVRSRTRSLFVPTIGLAVVLVGAAIGIYWQMMLRGNGTAQAGQAPAVPVLQAAAPAPSAGGLPEVSYEPPDAPALAADIPAPETTVWPVTEAAIDRRPSALAAAEPPPQPVTEPPLDRRSTADQPIAEAAAEPPPQPLTEPSLDRRSGPSDEPIAEAAAEPLPRPVTEPPLDRRSSPPADAAGEPADQPVTVATVEPTPAAAAPAPLHIAADVPPLLERGEAMLALGDIAAARLFFERAAALGSAQAATSLGKTFDPAFLASIEAAGVTPDRSKAAVWYTKAAALGDAEGSSRLAALGSGR